MLAGKCPWCGTFIAGDGQLSNNAWLDSFPTSDTRRWAEEFLDQLFQHGMRITAARRRIAAQVLAQRVEFTIGELLLSLPTVSVPTVYRCLADLTALGLLRRRQDHFESRYQVVMSLR